MSMLRLLRNSGVDFEEGKGSARHSVIPLKKGEIFLSSSYICGVPEQEETGVLFEN